jgi:D-proline reductase (dithiol) PrdB
MVILENRDQWLSEFQAGWLKHYEETGEKNWRIYNLPRNSAAPSGSGIDLSHSRLMLITSAGAYLKGEQMPFDDGNATGDYTIRVFPSDTSPEQIDFAHPFYDHSAVDGDQQVLVPLGHLHDLTAEGVIGELAPSVVSFMGYQPVATRLVDETVPAVLEAVRAEEVDAVLLVPS